MLKLGNRLKKISEYVDKDSLVTDIGTDHGYIPAYLIQENIISRAVLSDINEGPIENAKSTFIENEIYDKGKFYLSSGLKNIGDDELDNVIIAGMGGLMIMKILMEDFEKAKKINKLILQPMQNKKELREFLLTNGFDIVDEALVSEGRHIYEIIICRYDSVVRYSDDIVNECGYKLPFKKDKLFVDFIEQKISSVKTAIAGLQRSNSEDNEEKILDCKEKLEKYNVLLANHEKIINDEEYKNEDVGKITVKEILNILDEKYPLRYAYDWDNCGHLIGNPDKLVNTCLTTLEITDDVIDEAIENNIDLIISHHPVIFSGLKKISFDDLKGRHLIKLIRNDIDVISIHTNFDIAEDGLNDSFAKLIELRDIKILDVIGEDDKGAYGMGRVGRLENSMSLKELGEKLKSMLKIDAVRVVGDLEDEIEKVAIVTGSGAEYYTLLKDTDIDVLITGDLKYHTAQDALSDGINIIDCGHFGTEDFFKSICSKYLKSKGIRVMESRTNLNPLQTI